MQLLLLLSALLSAITGGLSPTRGEALRVDQAEAQLVAPVLAPQRATALAPRPVEPCVPVRHSADALCVEQQVAVHAAPLASVRLIE